MAIKPEDRPVPEVPAHEDEFLRIKELYDRHAVSVSIALAIVLAVFVAVSLVSARKRSAVQRAQVMLSEAVTTDDFSAIVDSYGSTPSAPLAMLKLAKMQFNDGAYARAIETYERFTKRHADHALAASATLGILHCMEATSRLEEALAGYRSFQKDHPDHFLTTQALLGEARCLNLLGRIDEAIALYEDFLTANPESQWVPRVEEILAATRKQVERAAAPPAAVAPPTPAAASVDVPAPAAPAPGAAAAPTVAVPPVQVPAPAPEAVPPAP